MFSRTKNIKLSPIKQIELLASKIPDVISLAQGVPSFDTPEIIKKAALKALNRGVVAKYSLTYGLPELRETIEQKLAEENMYYDFEKEIIVTAGSIEAITASLISIINDKKNEVILFSPTYTSYSEAVKVAGGRPIFVNLVEKLGWQIDFKNLSKKISNKTAAIIICNPNNPTGTIFSRENLLKIAELACKRKIFIICDEVYKDFVYDIRNYADLHADLIKETRSARGSASDQRNIDQRESAFFSLAQIPELRKIVIRVFSLSKAYAMTGWRIGFLHSDEENVKEIIKVHDSLVTCAPVISQYAAMAALDFADKEIEEFRQKYQARRDLICQHLDELSEFFSYQKPEGSYFVFPKITQTNADGAQTNAEKSPRQSAFSQRESVSWRFAIDLLEKAHVAVVPGIAFGPSGENHIRMSFGRSEKDINEAMRRIKEYLG
jgi:aspartate/methionine/tyrosine aminotransferase